MKQYARRMKVKAFDIEAGAMISVMNRDDARDLGIFPLDRIEIFNPRLKSRIASVVDVTESMVEKGTIGMFKDVKEKLRIEKQDTVEVRAVSAPESISYIKKKLDGQKLSEREIKTIVRDIGNNVLSELETAAFVSAIYIHGYDLDETTAMTNALVEDGKQLKLERGPVVDKHSVGGINGRTTMVIVPIMAAAGYYMPKTSSRSVTSAAGTADAMEVLANVSLSLNQIKKITESVGAVIAWGGALDLAPVDDKIIKIEHPFSLDPTGQIVASVLAKKASVGSRHVVIDLPIGPDVKIKTRERGKEMAMKFIEVGKRMGMKIEAVLTDGTEPNGKAFGAALEAKYVMQTLEGKIYDNLAEKSCQLAGALFELVGKTKKGKGPDLAREILKSGQALKKMKEIIKAQGAKALGSDEIEESRMRKTVYSGCGGEIKKINLRECIMVSRIAGAPNDKKAGLMLKVEPGERVKKGQALFDIFAENKRKLASAAAYAKKTQVVEMEQVILEKFQ